MRGLSNKVAIVTGGATLIGARVAKKLADLKVSVLIADTAANRLAGSVISPSAINAISWR